MKALIRILIISLLMSTSATNIAFAEMAGTQTMSEPMADHSSHMPMTSSTMSEHCQGDDAPHAMDSYCMDHCAHLLALGIQYQIFISEIPTSVITDLVFSLPTPEPSALWRPPTLNS